MTESEAYVALNLVPGMGAVTVRAGIAAFGSAAAFFQRRIVESSAGQSSEPATAARIVRSS